MARYVTLATIGAEPLLFPTGSRFHGQEAVDRMIDFWRGKIAQVLPSQPDLILLPECCDRYPEQGLVERLEYYTLRGDKIRDFFREQAKEHHCYIGYSAIRDGGNGTWRNSTQLIDRNGEIAGIYDKNHPVIEETTEGKILCGNSAPIIECDFGRVACAICFDLNFDELRLKYKTAKPDLILFSSMYHGGLMQRYWAYSCRAHFMSAIAGAESGVISPVGEPLARTTNYFDHIATRVNLDCAVAHLDYNWGRLDNMLKKYGTKVTRFDPGFLGSVLIGSETDEFTIRDMIAEFGIELLDDYMTRALEHHHNPENIAP